MSTSLSFPLLSLRMEDTQFRKQMQLEQILKYRKRAQRYDAKQISSHYDRPLPSINQQSHLSVVFWRNHQPILPFPTRRYRDASANKLPTGDPEKLEEEYERVQQKHQQLKDVITRMQSDYPKYARFFGRLQALV